MKIINTLLKKFSFPLALLVFLLIVCLGLLFNIPAKELFSDGDIQGVISDEKLYQVIEVVDGDTIKIEYNGTVESVRMIGIDAPEVTWGKNECFGAEAKKKLTQLTMNKYVRIEFDQSQGDRDSFGRLLGYIFLDDRNINKGMIEEGYAHEYTYNIPYEYQVEFKEAENTARSNEIGLWGDVCSNS